MMNDPSENVQTLTEELASLKRRIRELEQAESKRREAEEALRESELKFRTIFDKASDGILITDVITKSFLQGNNAICAMLGYMKEEIEKLTLHDIHPPENLPYVLNEFEKQARGEKVFVEDLPVRRKEGSIFYTDVGASRLTIGGRNYLLCIFHDITDRKTIEILLRDSKKKIPGTQHHR